MARRPDLIPVLDAWIAATVLWLPDRPHEQATHRRARIDAANESLLAAAALHAETGDPAAIRLHDALTAETEYAAGNAAAGDPMHRKVPDYTAVVHGEHARLIADRDGYPAGTVTAWCPSCRTRRAVEEASNESAYEGHHEVGYHVTRLACGHVVESEGRVVGRSPGGEAAAEATAETVVQRRLDLAAKVGGL